MIYENFVRDFAKRTLLNLDFIETYAEYEENVYEITQSINSLLGLVVVPREKNLNGLIVSVLEKNKFLELRKSIENHPDYKIYSGKHSYNFIDLLRNAVAHANIEIVGSENKISGIYFWNCPSSPYTKERSDWMVFLDARQISILCRILADGIESSFKSEAEK